ncbi:MAG: hypothetical protein ACLQDV_07115 [Candidatus Binataceae bacterium]
MSNYLFGEFYFRGMPSASEREDLAFSLTAAALRARIHVQLAFNIVQREVLAVLKRTDGGLSSESVAFLLTESPLSNTSDELLEPLNVMPLDMERVIRERLRRVEAFLKSTQLMDFKGLSLYTETWSEGYGAPRRQEEIPLEFLVDRLLDLYTELHAIPSARFVITF